MGLPTILLMGGNGQIGWELRQTLAPIGSVTAHDRDTLDLTDFDAVRKVVRASTPAVIVNAAAYTRVDRAETDTETVQRVNADAPAVLAEEARRSGALLVHYSTDYVFDGLATRAYREDDTPIPTSVYGRTKYAGDLAVLDSGAEAYVFRIGWVYGLRGNNFLRTIQRLAAQRPEIGVVVDQHGAPTWCRAIAETTAAAVSILLDSRLAGSMPPTHRVYHMAPPDATTWFDFATAIVEGSTPMASRPTIRPIATAEYPTAARRPHWSVLDSHLLQSTFGLSMAPWREQLRSCLASSGASFR